MIPVRVDCKTDHIFARAREQARSLNESSKASVKNEEQDGERRDSQARIRRFSGAWRLASINNKAQQFRAEGSYLFFWSLR